MDIELQNALTNAIKKTSGHEQVILRLSPQEKGGGSIEYNQNGVWIDPNAAFVSHGRAVLTDEELVRAYLLTKLISIYGYSAAPETLEIERGYKPVGRPVGKGGRVDILVRRKTQNGKKGAAFLFIECKSPSKFDEDLKFIDGQLFRLSLQEQPRPKYLVYFTSDFRHGELRDSRIILIDTEAFTSYEDWDKAGQPITDIIPARYGRPKQRRYANVETEAERYKPLDQTATPEIFNRLRVELHDVIWGGGGTNNNEVFVYIVKLILCKIFDENETEPGKQYEFQRLGDEIEPESPLALTERMNVLYGKAEKTYLALPTVSAGSAFDPSRLSTEKLAYVVGRLEGLSLTSNIHTGDLLGEFFEQIVSQDFTQTKGQFFTPIKLVRFMLHLADTPLYVKKVLETGRDHLGRPRLPYVIDPACGSGSFLIEYMKLVSAKIGNSEVGKKLPQRVKDSHRAWFQTGNKNLWAREFIFGIENNYDLGLAAKVNMVLHGDGSMNTWIASGLLPFEEYWVDGRTNILGVDKDTEKSPYQARVNEQFDQIFSNPPFSLKFSPDEKKKIQRAFVETSSSISEKIFIERWYQLLRPGGRLCCVLPETILDTAANSYVRLFLVQHFYIQAIISLPYDAFRPFTSTKTCIILATKRPPKDALAWRQAWDKYAKPQKKSSPNEVFEQVITELGWAETPIFMAEPDYVGYKRRKNLPDLPMPNRLFIESDGGQLNPESLVRPDCVLGRFKMKSYGAPSAQLGFWTNLSKVAKRETFRLDPKYRWFWDFQDGVGHGDSVKAIPLRTLLEIVNLQKISKGDLPEETRLIDLEYVESRQALVRDDTPTVETIGSDKVRFNGADIAISKLEPYLGKVIIKPPTDAIGSTEWIGFKLKENIPTDVLVYLLMLPDMCEAYRRLQSGKRHARFNPEEFLDIKVQVPDPAEYDGLSKIVQQRRGNILRLREEEKTQRKEIDKLYFSPEEGG